MSISNQSFNKYLWLCIVGIIMLIMLSCEDELIPIPEFFLYGEPPIKIEYDEASITSLKIMSWNIVGYLNLYPQYTINNKTAMQRSIEVMQDNNVDIVLVQEAYSGIVEIAKALNFYYILPSNSLNLAILSRYPIVDYGSVPGLSTTNFIVATVVLPNKQRVRLYNTHLNAYGRSIDLIRSSTISDEEFNEGDEIRYIQFQTLINHIKFILDMKKVEDIPIIVAGDFNNISHLDYTAETKANNLNYGRILPNKISLKMKELGFVDTFRQANQVITQDTLGYTWSTESIVPFVRIDFIYFLGTKISLENSTTVTRYRNSKENFPEFPSDHNAVLTTFSIKK